MASDATVFMGFSVKVVWQGELFFYKGETNEDSINISDYEISQALQAD